MRRGRARQMGVMFWDPEGDQTRGRFGRSRGKVDHCSTGPGRRAGHGQRLRSQRGGGGEGGGGGGGGQGGGRWMMKQHGNGCRSVTDSLARVLGALVVTIFSATAGTAGGGVWGCATQHAGGAGAGAPTNP